MPVKMQRPCLTEYLASHPQDINVTFSFPDGRQLGSNKLLLSMASQVFEAMFSGNWQEDEVVNLPDTNLEAFQLFTQILYYKKVDLSKADWLTCDQLYYLADKYMVEEIKIQITDCAKDNSTSGEGGWGDVWDGTDTAENLTMLGKCTMSMLLMEHMKTDAVKEIITNNIIQNFNSFNEYVPADMGEVKYPYDLSKVPKFYCREKFSEPMKEAIVEAAKALIGDPVKVGVKKIRNMSNFIFSHHPQSEENMKFLVKVMNLNFLVNE